MTGSWENISATLSITLASRTANQFQIGRVRTTGVIEVCWDGRLGSRHLVRPKESTYLGTLGISLAI